MNESSSILSREYFLLNSDLSFTRESPLCLDNFILIFVVKGTARLHIDNTDYVVNGNKFVMARPRLKIRLVSASEDFDACIISFPSTMIHENTPRIEPSYFMILYKRIVWPLSGKRKDLLNHFLALFEFAVSDSGKILYTREMVLALVTSFIYALYSFTHNYLLIEEYEDSSRSRELFKKFIHLMNTHFMAQHEVQFYASELCISSKYLTQITKRMIGRTPKQIIDEKLIYEASVLLNNNNSSIQEISSKLGFVDQSYFGRFFKRFKHVSPQQYRLKPKK